MFAACPQVGGAIDRLIERCQEDECGFLAAAREVRDPGVRDELLVYARQRRAFATHLQRALWGFGEKPRGGVLDASYRGWFRRCEGVEADDRSILAQCARGAQATIDAYMAVLIEGAPSAIDDLITSQYLALKCANDRIGGLWVLCRLSSNSDLVSSSQIMVGAPDEGSVEGD